MAKPCSKLLIIYSTIDFYSELPNMKKPIDLSFFDDLSVLVIGDVMLDRYIWGRVDRISPEAPVPVIDVQRDSEAIGGAGNVALNLASLGVQVELFGLLGEDEPSRVVQQILLKSNISFCKSLIRRGVDTITKTRVIAQGQQICRLDRESARDQYSLGADDFAALRSRVERFDAVIISDYAKGVVTQQVLDSMSFLAKRKNIFLAIDPKPKSRLCLAGMNLIKPNKTEAYQLSDLQPHNWSVSEVIQICNLIKNKWNPEYLAVTLSEEGLILCGPDGQNSIYPTTAKEVADVSGAGDTVIAILTSALAKNVSSADAAHLANVAAGLVIAKVGTATVTRHELINALSIDDSLNKCT